jgi:type I restriction enzyme S subunit
MLIGPRLKISILRSALQGKLVSQNKEDEPASALVERARAEKRLYESLAGNNRNVIDSVIYRDKDNPETFFEWVDESYVTDITSELPFEVPDSWEWARLGSFASLKAGKAIDSDKVTDTQTGLLYPCFGGNGFRGYTETYNREGRHPIIGRQGALCGNINFAEGKYYATEHAIVAMSFGGTRVDWFGCILEALDLNHCRTATAQPGLAVRGLNQVLIPIPPVEEQARIEERLKSLLDIYEKIMEVERKREAKDIEFPLRFRKSLMREAVRGMLGTGDPSESASGLRKEMLETRLAPPKKSKLSWPESSIFRDPEDPGRFYEKLRRGEPEEITGSLPFEIPPNWEWARLRDMACGHGSAVPEKDFSYIDIRSIDNKRHELCDPLRILSPGEQPGSKKIVKKGDILYSMVRPYLSNMCMVEKEYGKTPYASSSIIVLGCHELMCSRFVFLYMMSPDFCNYANEFESMKGTAYPTIKEARLLEALIPIPPRAEQERIVAKLDKMIPLLQEFVDKRVELLRKMFAKIGALKDSAE